MINSATAIPLHQQIEREIRADIRAGIYPPGCRLPTEQQLCRRFGVSRYPLRQAFDRLSRAGLVVRVAGKGTFVSRNGEAPEPEPTPAAASAQAAGRRLIALLIPDLLGDYPRDIARGVVQTAGEAGFAPLVFFNGKSTDEANLFDHLPELGVGGLILFPHDRSAVDQAVRTGLPVCLIDRNPGRTDVDFVETDNLGGGFMAARHMHLHGFTAAVCVAQQHGLSSVRERLTGFARGAEQVQLDWLNRPADWAECLRHPDCLAAEDFSLVRFEADLALYRNRLPLAVFCENDQLALRVMDCLRAAGLAIGRQVGVIGFDNDSAGRFSDPPLTSVAQNGWLIGEAAARLTIGRITSPAGPFVRHILPTQIVSRRSCGENRLSDT
jgi:DNA-binding LacI/PurR family transcriptional regulator